MRAARIVNIPHLPARTRPWMDDLAGDPDLLGALVDRWGSPLHLHVPGELVANAQGYTRLAASQGVALDVYFARKANKGLAYVDVARDAGLGVDVAGERELLQTLERGVPGPRIVVTAAIKPASLLRLAAEIGAVVVVDHLGELDALREIARSSAEPVRVALRLRGFAQTPRAYPSRFGIPIDEVGGLLPILRAAAIDGIRTAGLHFHLDGYSAADRAEALDRCIDCADMLRDSGLPVEFIDMGGGFPVCYTRTAADWETFLGELDQALMGHREPVTYRNTGLGRLPAPGGPIGSPAVYPHYQTPVGPAWLETILGSTHAASGESIAVALARRGLTLRAEPGRALVDGCGVTVARIEFVKPAAAGQHFVGVAMNSSNCRSRKSELLTDPVVVRSDRPADRAPVEGFLVGRYCSEDDLITSRRLWFPDGLAPGDLMLFFNTAGYYMHFVESRSHQFPLPLNVILEPGLTGARLDPIDASREGES